MGREKLTRRGFTLLQTAALAGLSGIALLGSNIIFSEGELNALVAESRARQAAIAAGLEAYIVDWGIAPYDGFNYVWGGVTDRLYNYWHIPNEMTTPVAYVDALVLGDPFREILVETELNWQWNNIRYTGMESTWGTPWDFLQGGGLHESQFLESVLMEWGEWRLVVVGPDGSYGPSGWQGVSGYPSCTVPYDPTNGVMSDGDLVWSQLAPQGYLNLPPLE